MLQADVPGIMRLGRVSRTRFETSSMLRLDFLGSGGSRLLRSIRPTSVRLRLSSHRLNRRGRSLSLGGSPK